MTQWRRGWDSNPRDPFGPNGFQDRRSQPLSYPSICVDLLMLTYDARFAKGVRFIGNSLNV
jgi:hypothetical protein